MLKGPLLEKRFIKPIDLFFYSMILAQKTGDPKLDSELCYTHSRASMFTSSSTYSLSKFRLWAFRMLEVVKWGRKDQTPTKFKESKRWLTLIHFPEKMIRINTLVKRYERVFNFHPKNPEKRSKEERSKKKRLLYQTLKREIIDIFQ
jgi:hypothetical protein